MTDLPDPIATELAAIRLRFGARPSDVPRMLNALHAIRGLTRDSDGSYLPPGCYVPVGEFQSALVDALTGPPDWRPDSPPDGPAPEYLTVFADFWAPIVQRPDGTLNFGQIARELADYHDLMGWASEVYVSVTGGRISKVNTLPSAVIGQANECTEEAVAAAIGDLISGIEEAERGPFRSTAEVVALIREITGRAEVPDHV